MLVLIRNGEAQLLEDVSSLNDDHIARMIGAPELRRLPLRTHPLDGTEIVAYASSDPRGYVPNCRIEKSRYPVYGPVLILGYEDGRHRQLRDEEILAIELVPPRRGERLPCLRVKEEVDTSLVREGGTAA
ncbi:MAG: hypothetical protein P8188_10165 [Gemmatimonadota bacterium]